MKLFTCNAVAAIAVTFFSIFSTVNEVFAVADPTIPLEELSEMTCGTLDGIYFYDQVTDAPIYGPIVDGEQIDVSELTAQYYLAAHVSGAVESVTFWVDGFTSSENDAPYTFPGGAHNGTNWTGGVGTHNVDANAYNSDDASGDHCGQIWLTFELTDNGNNCDNVTSSGSISADGTVCNGSSYTINSNSLPSGGSGTLEFVWLFNPNAPQVSGHTPIISNTSDLTISPSESGYYRRCARRSGCTAYDGESNWVFVEVTTCCNLEVNVGLDQTLCNNEPLTITANASNESSCNTDCSPSATNLIASYDMNACYSNSGDGSNTDYSELIASTSNLSCANTTATSLYRNEGAHSCTQSYDNDPGDAMCVDMSGITSFSDDHAKALRFDITMDPNGNGETTGLTKLEFRLLAPTTYWWNSSGNTSGNTGINNYPTQFGFRILKNGVEIHQEENLPTPQSWQLISRDFTGSESFKITANTTFSFEFLGYDPIGNGGNVTVLDFDDIKLYGGCCSPTNSSNINYAWSNGENSQSISVDQPGTYSVTATDCLGCTATDEIVIDTCCDQEIITDLQPEINVTCGDNLPTPTFTNGTVVGTDQYPAIQACTIDLSSHASYNWRNFWFHSFPTIYDKNFVWDEGYMVVNPDSTVEIFGTVYNNTLTSSGFNIHYYFEQLENYSTWIAGGGYNSTDAEAPLRYYAQVDFTKPNSIVGFGEFENSDLQIVSTGDVAFMDLGPRDVYGGYGVGYWIDYSGTVNSYPAGNSLTMTAANHNDMYASLSGCTVEPTNPCTERTIREWTVLSDCNVEQTFLQNVVINNSIAPVASNVPTDLTLTCTDNLPSDEPTFTDNCGQTISIVPNETTLALACGQQITKTWTATSECGLSTSVAQVITITDNAPPSGTPVANVTIDCNDPLPTSAPEFTDDCDNALDIDLEEVFTDLACGHTYVRSWTATDDCGNVSLPVVQTINVVDNGAPVFTSPLPQDLTVDCFDEIPVPDAITASDDCGMANIQYAQTVPANTCNDSFTRTWTVTDECGNTIQHVQNITILDNIAPVLSDQPADLTIECIDELPPVPTINATDNCDSDPTLTFIEDPTTDGCGEGVRRTWTATDDCGNETLYIQSIFVIDTTAPTASTMNNVSLTCEDTLPTDAPVFTDNCDDNLTVSFNEVTNTLTCGYELIKSWFATDLCGNVSPTITQTITVIDSTAPIGTNVANVTQDCEDSLPIDEPTFSDDCDNDLEITFEEVLNDLPCGSEIIRTWFATDDCGNVSSIIDQVITLTDSSAPIFTDAPANETVQCLEDVPAAIAPTATDNCGQANINFSQSVATSSCNETLTRTWTANDECGNTSSVTQTITINDTTAPEAANVPQDVTIECNDPVPTDEPTFTDNCSSDVTVTMIENIVDLPCGVEITKTWTAVDLCGNETVLIQVITVIDTTPPIINAGEDMTIECGDPIPGPSHIASDSCGDVDVSLSITTPAGCGNTQVITRTCTATDECGNTATDVQVITIVDTTPPTINAGEDMTIECGDPIPAPSHIASDSCGDVDVSLSITTPAGCGNTQVITRTCTATDECGNTATDVQVITIVDTTPPTINAGEDMTIECGDPIPAPSHIASDSCGDVDVSLSITTPAGCGNTQVITRTCTATDECGNTATDVQVITIVDTTPPTINAGEDMTIECGDPIPGPSHIASDSCGDVDVSLSITTPTGCGNTQVITRTCTATDECGNTATDIQVITIVDTTDPVASNEPADVTLDCDATLPTDTPVFTDNCDNDLEITFEEVLNDLSCGSEIIRTWFATDDCGNVSSTIDQVITLTDTSAPVLTNAPANETVQCLEDFPEAIAPTATDNCGQANINFSQNCCYFKLQ